MTMTTGIAARSAAARVFLLILAATAAGGAAVARPPDPQAALIGVWAPDDPSERLLVPAEGAAPLTPEAATLHAQRLAERNRPDPQFDRTRWCAGPGMPRIMLMPYPFEIKSERGYLAFLFGWYRWYRLIDMSGQEPEFVLPATMGYSAGHWEGRTLVIKTAGIEDETVLDASGLPHSDQMTLTERVRVLPSGHLEVRFTIDDAAFYTRPWTSVATYHPAPRVTIKDDICPDRIARGEPAIAAKRP
ncbi:MAG TPA: hypothetical protein VIJ94_11915 [Caulobacteraceae bacterium]